jgi:peroxiredoxin
MADLQTAPALGVPAPQFALPATDGKTYSLADIAGENGTVLAVICNHCPYVKAVVDRMVEAAETLAKEGIGFAAICSNDSVSHPGDSFDNMKLFAEERGFSFPYLHDESQEIARALDAACTPEFFGISREGTIEYHGRLDEGRKDPPPPNAKPELIEAMRMIAKTGKGPQEQFSSVGCSVKWKQ